MAKAALAVWNDRIAPVFDVAGRLRIVEARSGRIVADTEEDLSDRPPTQKAVRLAELGVDVLICGAISRPMQALVSAYGIRVIPFVTGDLKALIRNFAGGRLVERAFAMPGCGLRFRKTHGFGRGGYGMRGRSAGGQGFGGGGGGAGGGGGRGGGAGRGGGFGKGGRMGGPQAGGPGGVCVCPQCGHQEPHQRGVPCIQRHCPACGVNLVRG